MVFKDSREPSPDFPQDPFGDGDDSPYETYAFEVVQAIGEKVIWPTVNTKLDGDWVTDSIPGQVAIWPKVGVYNGRMLEVTLMAECDRYSLVAVNTTEEGESEETSATVHTASIIIEEPAPEMLEPLLTQAKTEEPRGFEEWLNDEGLREEDLRSGKIIVSRGIRYRFDAKGGCVIRVFGNLRDKNRKEFWDSINGFIDYDEDEAEDPQEEDIGDEVLFPDFASSDVDNLRAAMEILSAPEDAIVYLEVLAGAEQ